MKFLIEGVITTASPFHVTAPEKNLRYDPSTARFIRSNKGGSPCTPTRTQRIRSPLAVTESNPVGMLRLPVAPAQGFKGRLRRLAAAEIEDALRDMHDEMTPFPLYQAMHSGAVTGHPDGGAPALDVAKTRRNHFFAGLFGGGTQMIPGRLRTTGGRLVTEPLIELGSIPEWTLDHNPVPAAQIWNLFEAEPVIRKDDALQFTDPRASEVIENYDEVMLESLGQQANRRAAKVKADSEDAEPERRERGLQAFSFVETVVAGTSFYVRFSVDGTEAQAGCLLNALGRLLALPDDGLGGKAAIGYGEFQHSLSLKVDGEEVPDAFVSASGDDQGTALNVEAAGLAELLSAYETAMENLSVHEMQSIMTQGA